MCGALTCCTDCIKYVFNCGETSSAKKARQKKEKENFEIFQIALIVIGVGGSIVGAVTTGTICISAQIINAGATGLAGIINIKKNAILGHND